MCGMATEVAFIYAQGLRIMGQHPFQSTFTGPSSVCALSGHTTILIDLCVSETTCSAFWSIARLLPDLCCTCLGLHRIVHMKHRSSIPFSKLFSPNRGTSLQRLACRAQILRTSQVSLCARLVPDQSLRKPPLGRLHDHRAERAP